jgi:mono/diheme cytochrome c family protein
MFQPSGGNPVNTFKTLHRSMLAMTFLVAGASATAQGGNERGALLYDTHCVACHTTEAHWRDKRQAADWQGVVAQVRIWQANAKLNWSEGDIEAVSVYLNRRHYHYPPPAGY